MNQVSVIFVLLAALLTGGCGQVNSPASRTKFAPADRSAYNVALIVGSPNDLPGVGRDVTEVSNMLRGSNLGYDVVVLERATVEQIMEKSKEIGQKLSPNSTVFFYFSGHGSESGYLFAQGFRQFQMSQVAQQIGVGYAKGTFKRFIAVMDSCFSGQNVDGQKAMFAANGSHVSGPVSKSEQQVLETAVSTIAGDVKSNSHGTLPFEQALIVGASLKSQTSDDLGSSMGGAFTYSWRKAFAQGLKGQSATIGQVLNEAKALTRKTTGGSQTPVWRAMPESLLSETLGATAATVPLARNIFAALGGSTEGALMFASVPANIQVASIELCQGEKVVCMSGSAPRLANLIAAPTLIVSGRSIFRSDQYLNLQSGEVLTLVLRGANGAAIEARSIQIRSK